MLEVLDQLPHLVLHDERVGNGRRLFHEDSFRRDGRGPGGAAGDAKAGALGKALSG
ncbi:hypothetical protein GCM10017667_52800 [Streptomyces filamentosus]|uniref:Uncharacterized protein n=1 Tax=Streptomyces filamentosus TaxID=67294 RepID=A0A919EQT3_STRFL|nr:hypothetical protein GCM10017667_52800 [Streptomyces filamentosus]